MTDPLDRYFETELAALLEAGAALPDKDEIGKRLGISRDHVSDPHVERLLEGVAYLGARVQARLDDEFPELTDALLGMLYPHLLLPFPSCLMVQLEPKADLQHPALVPEHSPLQVASEVAGTRCRFRTAAPVTLWPVRIEAARLSGQPLPAPSNKLAPMAAGVLHLTLRCRDPGRTFDGLLRPAAAAGGLGPLRVQLLGRNGAELYQMLVAGTVAVAFADGKDDPGVVFRGPDSITQGGFAAADALIPWPVHGAAGFRHLLEYFALPDKYLCIDLHGINSRALAGCGNKLDVYVYLRDLPAGLEGTVSAASFGLFCVPAVNLFPQRCEPVKLDGTRTEYPVDPTRTGLRGMEVWSVEEVRETALDGTVRPWRRVFGRRDTRAGAPSEPGYMLMRRPARGGLAGEETTIAVVTPDARPGTDGRSQLAIRALCTNRDVPAALPFGDGEPVLTPERGLIGVAGIRPLTPATRTGRRPPARQRDWHLLSHLGMSHLLLTGGEAGVAALRALLALYDVRGTGETRAAIGALSGISAKPVAARLPGARPGVFCRGIEVTLAFSASEWSGRMFLFAAVLDRFLAAQAAANSFVRTTVMRQGHPNPIMRWPPRADTRPLL